MRIRSVLVAAGTVGVLTVGAAQLVPTMNASLPGAPTPVANIDEVDAEPLTFTAAEVSRSFGTVTASSGYSNVKALQHLLTARGVATDADGSYGPQTARNVRTYQSKVGLSADGIAGPLTLSSLAHTVRQGNIGNAVKATQQLLTKNGFSVSVDGVFGPGTAAAVVGFQRKQGISADGVVGPTTWSHLFRPSGSTGTQPPTPPAGGNCANVNGGVDSSHTVLISNGIRVHKCWAGQVDAMIKAAARDGVTLRPNSSWRSPAKQIALRRQNCGTSHYAIYQMPSGQCRPPTAIPGTSRHERGLAVDFANAGHGGAVFRWLSNNGHKYHIKNLPSESWHWSWDGR